MNELRNDERIEEDEAHLKNKQINKEKEIKRGQVLLLGHSDRILEGGFFLLARSFAPFFYFQSLFSLVFTDCEPGWHRLLKRTGKKNY